MKKTLIATMMLTSSLAFGGWAGNTFYSNNNSSDLELKDSEGHYTTFNITSSSVITTGSDANATFNEINVASGVSLEFGPNAYNPAYRNNQTVASLNLADNASVAVTNGTIHIGSTSLKDGASISGSTLYLTSGTITLGKNATIKTTGTLDIAGGSTLTINMAEGALIQSAAETNLHQLNTALTFKTETAAAAIEEAVRTEGLYTRVLMESGDSIWYSNGGSSGDARNTSITLGDASLNAAGFENLGVLYTTDGKHFTNSTGEEVTMSGKQYALVYTGTSYSGGNAAKSLMLVATPEPATATLSLLALAGLCARRKRR